MATGMTAYPPLHDVTLALDAQGDIIHLKLLGREYTDFRVPFSREDVERGLEDYGPERSVDPLAFFGTNLFNTLFSEERRRALWELLARVTAENGAIRLRVLTNLERVQHLPWELLFDSSRQDFIALSGRVALVRTRPDGYDRQAALAPLSKLRILAVTADPDGSLDAADELAAFGALIAGCSDRITLETLAQATTKTLLQKLAEGPFDVFVFFGAGSRDDRLSRAGGLRQSVRLVAEDAKDDGLFKRNELGAALFKADVRLAVMNGRDTDWIARSLAKHVPAALGFREQVRPQTRRMSIETLAKALLRGMPLDLGITQVRQAIDRNQPGSGEWCRLVFYLQPADGRFLLDPGAPATASAPAADDGEPSRELAKLMRLKQIYTTNLNALERGSATLSTDGASRLEELLDKLFDTTPDVAALDQKEATPTLGNPAALAKSYRDKLDGLDERIAEVKLTRPGRDGDGLI